MRDNQINFLFSRQFHIEFVKIKQAGYNFFIIYPQSKKGSHQTHNKIGKKDKRTAHDDMRWDGRARCGGSLGGRAAAAAGGRWGCSCAGGAATSGAGAVVGSAAAGGAMAGGEQGRRGGR
uniref:Uncharacterized protein n=1 Tax=Setaria viridis TaxID=4556 RepID=A0A4U6VRC6_SETVI|nr:hypothetical protein SEVIR_2G106800v2 [Setaria viridis]